MSRKPNVLCAGTCGQLIWSGHGTLPAGQSMCRPCRVKCRVPQACKACGAEFRESGFTNCATCRTTHRSPNTPPPECAVAACSNPQVYSNGLCKSHENRRSEGQRGIDWRARSGDRDRVRQKDRMKTRRRRARARDPLADDIYINVVGDRDGWRCGVPGCRRRPIDRTRPYPHPLSPSIDHIEPLSRGGLHVYANVRIAHLRCNVRRSNQFSYEQLALI